MKYLIFVLSIVFITGCAGTYQSKLEFNPSEPIRVVVLPFIQVNSNGKIIEEKGDLLIDQVGLVSNELQDTPEEFLRKLVQNELTKTALDVVAPSLVDSRLSHTGYSKTDLSFDLQKIWAAAPQDICPKLFDCDAILYGKVTEWDRSYFAIQSVSTVGMDLKLVSAKDSRVLFEAKATDSDSRGITKGPTGFSDLVIEPIRGLNSEIISDLARGMVRKSLESFYMQNRPEFLEAPPPSIFASAHDAHNGKLKGPLTVVMLGNAGMNASFSVGNVVQHHPMSERDAGHYIGQYYPLDQDRFSEQQVVVYLTDQFGRTTEQTLRKTLVSY